MAFRALVMVAAFGLALVGLPRGGTGVSALPATARPTTEPKLLRNVAGADPVAAVGRHVDDAAEPGRAAARVAPLEPDVTPTLVALSETTPIYSRPTRSSTRLGYLRTGTQIQRSHEPHGVEGCKAGWYRVVPEGYVCVGKTASLDTGHPLARLADRRPDRAAPLPYVYGRSRFPTPPRYARLPTLEEQRSVEPDLDHHLRLPEPKRAWKDLPWTPLPESLREGGALPLPYGTPRVGLWRGRATQNSGFAFIAFYESGERRFGLTADLELIPLDRVRPVEPSEFYGAILSETETLPVVFTKTRSAYVYSGHPLEGGLDIERQLEYREAVSVTGESIRAHGQRYLATRAGKWIVDRHLVRVDAMRKTPRWVKPGRRWIEISILNQTLVAYEGERPVYVTLVSTGAGGIGDPEKTHATVQGTFLVHTKHVTATMDGDEVGDEFDLRDVPYVQYFHEGYALHAAYWHDAFGTPRSHGCVNLSPSDARWLFHWTEPAVPQGWHSRLSLDDGTLVYIHP